LRAAARLEIADSIVNSEKVGFQFLSVHHSFRSARFSRFFFGAESASEWAVLAPLSVEGFPRFRQQGVLCLAKFSKARESARFFPSFSMSYFKDMHGAFWLCFLGGSVFQLWPRPKPVRCAPEADRAMEPLERLVTIPLARRKEF
jgi:hypothetical protein